MTTTETKTTETNNIATLVTDNGLTDRTAAFFLRYAEDSANWSGTPLFNGNVTITSAKADRGYLTSLKKKGLLDSFTTDDEINGRKTLLTWVTFTDAGKALLETLGYTVSEYGEIYRA